MTWTRVFNYRSVRAAEHAECWIHGGRFAPEGAAPSGSDRVVDLDAGGHLMVPRLIDLRAQWEPGASAACVVGGVGHVLSPSTQPARFFYRGDACRNDSGLSVRPMLACDDGLDLPACFDHAAQAGRTLWTHLGHPDWISSGVMSEGAYATRLGLPVVPASAQSDAFGRIVEAATRAGARVHVSGVTTSQCVAQLRAAKQNGIDVTADVGVHYLHLADVDVGFFDTRFRFTPPLGTLADRSAVCAAVLDGTIDAVVSDHTPSSPATKADFFARASSGAPGLGLTLSLMLSWAQRQHAPLAHAIRPLADGPASVLARDGAMGLGGLSAGSPADFCLVDPDAFWRPQDRLPAEQMRLSPFSDMFLSGEVVQTFHHGQRVSQGTP